jgi:hypothetical protein
MTQYKHLTLTNTNIHVHLILWRIMIGLFLKNIFGVSPCTYLLQKILLYVIKTKLKTK